MKAQYIRQIKKELSLPRKVKKEVLRDLDEAFASALEHGETEAQVIGRFGAPAEFAASMAAQFGVDAAQSKKRKAGIFGFAAFLVAAVAFSGYAAAQLGKAPPDAIGQADAMTQICLAGAFDISPILFAAGAAATVMAAWSMIRLLRKNRR